MAVTKAKKTNINRESVNKVEIRGGIVHKYKTASVLILTIATSSSQRMRDYPRVYFYGDLAEIADRDYNVGDHVTVVARVQTSRKYRSQSIVGEEIQPTEREFAQEFGIDKGRYLRDKNEVYLSGTFVRSYVPEGQEGAMVIVTIKATVPGYTNFPQITCFGKAIENVLEMQSGDNVCFKGYVQTNRKEYGQDGEPGEVRYFQSIVSYSAEKTE